MTQVMADANTVESKAAFARRLGVSRQAIQKHASTAGFPLDAAGNVHVSKALDWMERHIRGHSSDADETSDGGIIAARIRLLRVQSERQEIALRQERAESIPYSEARSALAAYIRMQRDMALQFAVRHGPSIAAEVGCNEAALIAALSAKMREALIEAADNRRPFPRVAKEAKLAGAEGGK